MCMCYSEEALKLVSHAKPLLTISPTYVSLPCTSSSSLKLHPSSSLTRLLSFLSFCIILSSLFSFKHPQLGSYRLTTMADRQPHQVQFHPQHRYEGGRYEGGLKGAQQRTGPSAPKVLAIVTVIPVGGGLLALSGITLVGTLIGLAVTTPLFILFSPILVPAALVIGFAVVSFLASGVFGLTGLTSLSWVTKYLRQAGQAVPEQLDQARRRMQDMAGYVGQKTKEAGQETQKKAQEGK